MSNVQLAERMWQRPRPCVRIAVFAVMIRACQYTSRGSIVLDNARILAHFRIPALT